MVKLSLYIKILHVLLVGSIIILILLLTYSPYSEARSYRHQQHQQRKHDPRRIYPRVIQRVRQVTSRLLRTRPQILRYRNTVKRIFKTPQKNRNPRAFRSQQARYGNFGPIPRHLSFRKRSVYSHQRPHLRYKKRPAYIHLRQSHQSFIARKHVYNRVNNKVRYNHHRAPPFTYTIPLKVGTRIALRGTGNCLGIVKIGRNHFNMRYKCGARPDHKTLVQLWYKAGKKTLVKKYL